jgi:PKD repeat protein
MKKAFTLFSMLMAILVVNAQTSISKTNVDKSQFGNAFSRYKVTSMPKKAVQPSGRTAVSAFSIDYAGVDAYYADQIGTDFFYVPFLDINKNYSNTDNLTHDYAYALFDTLLYLDANNGDIPAFVPRAQSTLTLDSIDVFFIHQHAVTNTSFDTIRFTIFDRDSLRFTGSGASIVASNNNIWDTLIITNTEIPLNVSNGGTPTFTGMTFYPNLSFAQGKTFGMRIDFAGDTANKFNLVASFRDDCANACVASETVANRPAPALPNALYYINATAGTQNISGINSVGFTCGPPCAEWYAQNWWIYPWVTASVEFSAAIVADSLRGCPGTVLNLSAYGFGTTATPLTYNWSTSSGQLSTTTDQNVSLVIGNTNATVNVTVTDANGDSVVTSVPVTSRGINVTITNPNPLTLNCGSTATISSTLTGIQTGKNYTWNTGATGTNVFSITVNAPGLYSVTVTNNAGCSSSASINVVYPNVTNTANFTLPNPPVCQGRPVTFLNTSTKTTGWNSTWDMLNDGSTLIFNEDATHTYLAAGTYTVKLTMDSASCAFSTTKTVNVLASTNAQCQDIGIDDVAFSDAISLQPNPSNGNITLTVSGAEKNLSVKVYNVIGSEVKNFVSDDISTTFSRNFDFSDLTNGTYLVKIQSGEKTAIKRFTISK